MSDLQRDIEFIDKLASKHAGPVSRRAWQRIKARLSELEADAERYRWLRDNAGVGQGEHVYEQMAYQFEVLTGVSHVSHIYHYAELPSIDAAIDAARGAK